jgi:hypothetical protein
MKAALASTTPETFAVPPGIQQVTVDAVSGKLPTDVTPTTVTETFASYAVPTTYDNVHVKVAFDSTTGQPATSTTPPANITYHVYNVLHSEMTNNPNWENPVIAWALANGYSYPPDQAITVSPNNNGQGGPSITILNPTDGTNITQTPFTVTVNATSNNLISKIDLIIDGEFYQSLTQQPFTFTVTKALTDGSHTIAAHAVDSSGASSDTSISITFSATAPLSLTQPSSDTLLQFPVALTAASDNLFDNVNFYYQNSSGVTKLIGAASNTDHTGQYHYTFNWNTPPTSGSYKLFAQSSNGYTSAKITVSVP